MGIIHRFSTEPELSRTLSQPYFSARLTAAQIEATVNLFHSEATIVPSIVTVSGVATHPEDDLIEPCTDNQT